MTAQSNSTLEGYVDQVDWQGMRGWAFDSATPGEALWLDVQIDDQDPVRFLANMRRQDLLDAGYLPGTYAFELRFPQPLDPLVPHNIDVRSARSSESLPNSPSMLIAAPRASNDQRSKFEASVEAALAADIAAAEHGPELDGSISYLLRQVDRLLQARADAQSGMTALNQFRLRWNDYIAGERAMPLQPDSRPWALVIDTNLPETAGQLALIQAVQSLGYRVAVVSTNNMGNGGAVAASLAAMEITVLGAPTFFTVEDVLRRQRGLYRAVILNGPLLAAAYTVITRLHQQRAKLVTMFSHALVGPGDAPLLFGAALLGEFVVADSAKMQADLAERLPGRRIDLLAEDAGVAEIASLLVQLLPRLHSKVEAPPSQPMGSEAGP